MQLRSIMVFLFAALGMFMVGYVVTIIGIIFPFLSHATATKEDVIEYAATFLLIGVAIGAFFLGNEVEKEKKPYISYFNMFVVLLFSLPLLFDFNVVLMNVSLFFMGIGLGGEFSAASGMVNRYFKNNQTSNLHGYIITFQGVGSLLGAVIALVIVYFSDSYDNWRLYMLSISLWAGFVLLGRLIIFSHPSMPVGALADKSTEPSHHNVFHFILQPGNASKLALTSLPWFCMDFSVYGVNLFTPTILRTLHINMQSQNQSIPKFFSHELSLLSGTTLINLFLVVGFLVGMAVSHKLNLIRLQIFGFLAMAVSFGLLLTGNRYAIMAMIFIGFVLFNLFMNMGPNLTTFRMPHHVFGQGKSATGQGISAGVGKIGGIIATLFFPFLLNKYGVNSVLSVVMGMALLGAFLTFYNRRLFRQ